MDIVVALVGLAIAMIVVVYITQPLIIKTRVKTAGQESPRDKLLAERDALYTTIRDLDLDFQTGKLVEADYRVIRETYTARGVEILKELDALGADRRLRLKPETADRSRRQAAAIDEIEAAVQARRKGKSQAAGRMAEEDEIEAAIRARRQTKISDQQSPISNQACPSCGTLFDPADRFCAKCGATLAMEAAR
jgi:ribosomal protein L32